MSVESPRRLATERTAATPQVRAFRLGTWLLILPALSFFSCSAVAGAVGFKGKPDYSGTLRQARSLGVRSDLGAVPSKVAGVSRKLSRPFASHIG
jgi:hypothetical protein